MPPERRRASIALRDRHESDAGGEALGSCSILLPCLLVGAEEEKLVFPDRAADHPAKLVLIQYRLGLTAAIDKKVICVQIDVAEELKRGPM